MSALPLYREAREAQRSGRTLRAKGRQWDGHPGLWYEKFFDRWKDDECEAIEEGGKQAWILGVVAAGRPATTVPAGDTALIREFHARRAALAEALGGFSVELTLQTPFVTGLGYEHPVENGFLWHPVLGAPYLPGSSVKGLLLAWVEAWAGAPQDEILHVFGGVDRETRPYDERTRETGGDPVPARVGSWIMFDALPLAPVELACEVMTPHDGGWRISEGTAVTPSDWVSPNPIPFLAVAPGARFAFAFAPRRGATQAGEGERKAAHARIETWLRDALDCLGVGGKTATGFGRFG